MTEGAGDRPRRVLFVSHDASRTGAPILLLESVRAMRSRHGIEPAVLLLRDGPLRGAFEALGPTAVVDHSGRRSPGQLLEATLRQLGRARAARAVAGARVRRARASLPPADAVWLSAAPSVSASRAVRPAPDVPVVAHVHELEGVLTEATTDRAAFDAALRSCDRIVVGAEVVADNLVANHGVDRDRIRVRAEFIADPSGVGAGDEAATAALRVRLGLPPDALVVGACGTASWRKGMDLFVQLAVLLAKAPADRPVHLVWVGGHDGELALDEARFDADLASVADWVHFVGEQAELAPWFDLFDVFVLPSREDSFPLVCLLAGSGGTPVVAFDSGVGSLLERANASSSAVPDLDLDRLAARVRGLLGDDRLRSDEGRRLQAEVHAHHTTSTAAEALWQDLADAAGWS